MADDEVVVEIEADEKPVAENSVATDPIADLKAQHDELVAEDKRKDQAIADANARAVVERQRAAAAEQERDATRSEITETRIGTVESGINAAKTEADAAQADYTAAMEAGDWKRAGDAQRRMSKAEATLSRLDEAKTNLEIEKATPKPEPRREVPAQQADPLEAFISARSAPTQKWLRDHPDEARALALGTDSRRAAKLNAADSDAVAEGYARDTPEYFGHVEKFLGMTKPNGKTNGNGTQQPRRASAPVAPVQASGGGSNGGTEVRLSKKEAASATDGTLVWNYDDPSGQKRFKKGDVIGTQEFARRKLAMQQSGQYDKSLTEQ